MVPWSRLALSAMKGRWPASFRVALLLGFVAFLRAEFGDKQGAPRALYDAGDGAGDVFAKAPVNVPDSAKSNLGHILGVRLPENGEVVPVKPDHVRTLSLITHLRFDLMPKLIYAESLLSGAVSPWARYVYVEHERAFNGLKEFCYGRGLHKGWGCRAVFNLHTAACPFCPPEGIY